MKAPWSWADDAARLAGRVARAVVGAIAAGALLTGIAAGQTRGTITGRVVNDLGYPQSPATVLLVNLDTEVERPAVTESDGTFIKLPATIAGIQRKD